MTIVAKYVLPEAESTPVPKNRINTAAPPGASVRDLCAALDGAVPLPSGYPRLNPSCATRERIEWSEDRGRPKLFCSPQCRSAYEYERAEIVCDLETVQAALKCGGGTYREQRRVQSAERQLRFALLRFPYEPAKNRGRKSRTTDGD